MKITFLGTCAATEPMPDRHHCAWVIEHDGGVYWFDAGEGGVYRAHLMGIDLSRLRAVFISHTHFDHIGGLPHLFWTLGKLSERRPEAHRRLAAHAIPLFVPETAPVDAALAMLDGADEGLAPHITIQNQSYQAGTIFEENGLRVTAKRNGHLAADHPCRSFSFRIDCGANNIVYSGDVDAVDDYIDMVEDSTYVFMETGHHEVDKVCRQFAECSRTFGTLVFTHHGRAILEDPEAELAKAKSILGDKVMFAHDGLKLDV